MTTGIIEALEARQSGIHAHDCSFITMNGKPVYACGGTYVCPRCEREFGWCIGSFDDTPALCDECANVVQDAAVELPACTCQSAGTPRGCPVHWGP